MLENRLAYFELLAAECANLEVPESMPEKLAVERTAHLLIEIIIDVGNQMIDGFIMRDPGGYHDILTILADEKVISDNDRDAVQRVIPWRNTLMQEYTEIDHEALFSALIQEFDSFMRFPANVRTYIAEEEGPVSAFLPQKE
ncbi:DUF86 domain-containing protein [Salisediminibacterium halotolerans]|uniref:DUF86 domain-containing protein n=1 Tax=Salisediminibacterium halotolerans TaxID=517425 RepID=UPI001F551181|nr:DUF86 domain-containing protein [Salisediminibacterium halotolerans]